MGGTEPLKPPALQLLSPLSSGLELVRGPQAVGQALRVFWALFLPSKGFAGEQAAWAAKLTLG